MRYGFEFWRRHGHEVKLRLLLTIHTKAGDIAASGIDLSGAVRRLKAEDGILFLEGVDAANTKYKMERFYALVSGAPAAAKEDAETLITSLLGKGPEANFGAEVARAVTATGVRAVYADVLTDGTGVADRTAMMLKEAAAAIEDDTGNDAVELLRVRHSEDHYRDMYIIGKMGAMLADEFNSSDRIPPADLLVGILHKSIGRILTAMNVQVTTEGGLTERRGVHMLADIHAKGELTPRDIIALVNDIYGG